MSSPSRGRLARVGSPDAAWAEEPAKAIVPYPSPSSEVQDREAAADEVGLVAAGTQSLPADADLLGACRAAGFPEHLPQLAPRDKVSSEALRQLRPSLPQPSQLPPQFRLLDV